MLRTLLNQARYMLRERAHFIRDYWDTRRAEWEAETEPGYRMGGFTEAVCDVELAWADLLDALAGRP